MWYTVHNTINYFEHNLQLNAFSNNEQQTHFILIIGFVWLTIPNPVIMKLILICHRLNYHRVKHLDSWYRLLDSHNVMEKNFYYRHKNTMGNIKFLGIVMMAYFAVGYIIILLSIMHVKCFVMPLLSILQYWNVKRSVFRVK